jgi:putative transcriptional regulator
MIDQRILKMHALMKRQHELCTASDEDMAEADALLAEARRESNQNAMTGDRIRALRSREHLSQSQLAKYMYLSANSIQKWERGVAAPKGAALAILELIEKKGMGIFSELKPQ